MNSRVMVVGCGKNCSMAAVSPGNRESGKQRMTEGITLRLTQARSSDIITYRKG